MTEDPKHETGSGEGQEAGAAGSRYALVRMPAVAAIALYMLVLAGIAILDVVRGHSSAVNLFFPPLFIAAGLGLLLFLRWAWALTLAAVAIRMGLFLYQFSVSHGGSALVLGLLNLVFFLYLVRTEVRESLR